MGKYSKETSEGVWESTSRFYFSRRTKRENSISAGLIDTVNDDGDSALLALDITVNQPLTFPGIIKSKMVMEIDGQKYYPESGQLQPYSTSYQNRAISDNTYYEEMVPYMISLDLFKKICEAKSIKISFPGSLVDTIEAPAEFSVWCQCFYRERIDNEAFPSAYDKMSEIEAKQDKDNMIKTLVFWGVFLIGVIAVFLLWDEYAILSIIIIAVLVIMLGMRFPLIGAILSAFK